MTWTPKTKTCPGCGGSGMDKKDPCRTCEGLGVVYEWVRGVEEKAI